MVVQGLLSKMMRASSWIICSLLCCYYTANGYLSSRVISNVALNKPTNQSSTYQPSWLAVDGIIEPPTGMSTSEIGYQWWQVDLGSVYTVANVSIQNHITNPERLSNFTVELSATTNTDGHLLDARLCYNFTGPHVLGGQMITLPCPRDSIGRYIRISKIVRTAEDPLTFCEVIVEVSRDECNLADIALNKPTIQSSTWNRGVTPVNAGLAVDGNLNPILRGMSCTHTLLATDDNSQWWQVDLGGLYNIKQVSIQNRVYAAWRLADFSVEISDSNAMGPNGRLKNGRLCYNYTEAHVPSAELRTLPCPTGTVGRYLRITKRFDTLTLCEVIVEGKPVSCLETFCHNLPTIRQHDGQSVQDIVRELKQLMSGSGNRCSFRRKWIKGRKEATTGWYWSVWFPEY